MGRGGDQTNISGVSGQAQFQAAQTAALRQALTSAATQKKDGDGDHGNEVQGTSSGGTTGQLLNALA